MTLFDPYSHTRVHELRQEQLARKARLREKLGFDSLASGFDDSAAGNRLLTVFARISGRRPGSRRHQPGSPRPALDS